MPSKKESCGNCGNNFSQHIADVITTSLSGKILSYPLKKFNYILVFYRAEDRNEQNTIE